MSVPFPFSAIVGQDEMKQALLIAAVDQSVGGVLVLGDRGTGKSTAVRALAALLPPMTVVQGCPYQCAPDAVAGLCERCVVPQDAATQKLAKAIKATHGAKVTNATKTSNAIKAANLAKAAKAPKAAKLISLKKAAKTSVPTLLFTPAEVPVPVVDLPLGATEDRVVGALDLERALTAGTKRFEPGLLARAHRGFLYIDEVNLLEDHLVDLLLDVAASGENVVEREGLSLRHPARFVLVGSGNPEEGELRPQLLDRFGLSVEVRTPIDLQTRVEVIKRRDAFERDRQKFIAQWAPQEQALRQQVAAARALVTQVELPDAVLKQAAQLCLMLGTDGLRGELTLMRAARALAALQGKTLVEAAHLRQIAPSALRHRLRRSPLDDAGSSVRVERALAEAFADA